MYLIFFTAIMCGFVLGAPVGVAGALVADAALTHQRRRMELIIIAAVAGETILAYVTSFAAKFIENFLNDHKQTFYLLAGSLILIIAIVITVSTAKSHEGVISKEKIHGSSKWLLGHTAPALAAFLMNIVHPGSILAFLTTVAVFSTKFSDFNQHRWAFALGIMLGSGLIFSLSGLLFWKIRKKADKYVHYFRYCLAILVGLFGIYLLLFNVVCG